jgi:hypothetical protein
MVLFPAGAGVFAAGVLCANANVIVAAVLECPDRIKFNDLRRPDENRVAVDGADDYKPRDPHTN